MKRFGTLFATAIILLASLPAAAQSAYRIILDQPITPVTQEYVVHAIEKANAANAALILLQIDTPGGFVNSVEAIQRAILESKAPVVAYVAPVNARAASGGALVALACDVIAMAPGTAIGAAHPVSAIPFLPTPTVPEQPPAQPGAQPEKPGQKNPAEDVMLQKVLNDLSAHARSLAERRGRNAGAFEKMLRESTSLSEKEALDQHVIELVANDEGQVFAYVRSHPIKRFDGTMQAVVLPDPPDVRQINPTRLQRFLFGLANPNFTLVLLLLGIIGLYAEFKAPGMIFPGIIGGICILLFALSTQMLPINMVGLLLILLGVAFLILELKVVSYGMLGIGGVVSLLIGSLLLYRNSPIPELKVSLIFIVPVVLAFAAILLFLVTLAVRAFRNPVMTGDSLLVGHAGTVSQPIASGKKGKVFVAGEYWDAVSETPLDAGQRVIVTAVNGMVLEVKPDSNGGNP
ncbi:MAG: nodulation protein NfeD [Acidobacteria bacterium]|nr:nodulation protein NfeD [Acidobacteriota bacterium]